MMQLVIKRDMSDARELAERAGIEIDDYDDFIHDLAQAIADGRRPVEQEVGSPESK